MPSFDLQLNLNRKPAGGVSSTDLLVKRPANPSAADQLLTRRSRTGYTQAELKPSSRALVSKSATRSLSKTNIEWAGQQLDRKFGAVFAKNPGLRDTLMSWMWAKADGPTSTASIKVNGKSYQGFEAHYQELMGLLAGGKLDTVKATVKLYKEYRDGATPDAIEKTPKYIATNQPKYQPTKSTDRIGDVPPSTPSSPVTRFMPNPDYTQEDQTKEAQQRSRAAARLYRSQRYGVSPNTNMTSEELNAAGQKNIDRIKRQAELRTRLASPFGTLEDVEQVYEDTGTPIGFGPWSVTIDDAGKPSIFKNLGKSVVKSSIIRGKNYGDGPMYNSVIDSAFYASNPFTALSLMNTGKAIEELSPEERAAMQVGDFAFQMILSGGLTKAASGALSSEKLMATFARAGIDAKYAPTLLKVSQAASSAADSLPQFITLDVPGYAYMIKEADGDISKAASAFGGQIVDGFNPATYLDPSKPADEKAGAAIGAITGLILGSAAISKVHGMFESGRLSRSVRSITPEDATNIKAAAAYLDASGMRVPADWAGNINVIKAQMIKHNITGVTPEEVLKVSYVAQGGGIFRNAARMGVGEAAGKFKENYDARTAPKDAPTYIEGEVVKPPAKAIEPPAASRRPAEPATQDVPPAPTRPVQDAPRSVDVGAAPVRDVPAPKPDNRPPLELKPDPQYDFGKLGVMSAQEINNLGRKWEIIASDWLTPSDFLDYHPSLDSEKFDLYKGYRRNAVSSPTEFDAIYAIAPKDREVLDKLGIPQDTPFFYLGPAEFSKKDLEALDAGSIPDVFDYPISQIGKTVADPYEMGGRLWSMKDYEPPSSRDYEVATPDGKTAPMHQAIKSAYENKTPLGEYSERLKPDKWIRYVANGNVPTNWLFHHTVNYNAFYNPVTDQAFATGTYFEGNEKVIKSLESDAQPAQEQAPSQNTQEAPKAPEINADAPEPAVVPVVNDATAKAPVPESKAPAPVQEPAPAESAPAEKPAQEPQPQQAKPDEIGKVTEHKYGITSTLADYGDGVVKTIVKFDGKLTKDAFSYLRGRSTAYKGGYSNHKKGFAFKDQGKASQFIDASISYFDKLAGRGASPFEDGKSLTPSEPTTQVAPAAQTPAPKPKAPEVSNPESSVYIDGRPQSLLERLTDVRWLKIPIQKEVIDFLRGNQAIYNAIASGDVQNMELEVRNQAPMHLAKMMMDALRTDKALGKKYDSKEFKDKFLEDAVYLSKYFTYRVALPNWMFGTLFHLVNAHAPLKLRMLSSGEAMTDKVFIDYDGYDEELINKAVSRSLETSTVGQEATMEVIPNKGVVLSHPSRQTQPAPKSKAPDTADVGIGPKVIDAIAAGQLDNVKIIKVPGDISPKAQTPASTDAKAVPKDSPLTIPVRKIVAEFLKTPEVLNAIENSDLGNLKVEIDRQAPKYLAKLSSDAMAAGDNSWDKFLQVDYLKDFIAEANHLASYFNLKKILPDWLQGLLLDLTNANVPLLFKVDTRSEPGSYLLKYSDETLGQVEKIVKDAMRKAIGETNFKAAPFQKVVILEPDMFQKQSQDASSTENTDTIGNTDATTDTTGPVNTAAVRGPSSTSDAGQRPSQVQEGVAGGDAQGNSPGDRRPSGEGNVRPAATGAGTRSASSAGGGTSPGTGVRTPNGEGAGGRTKPAGESTRGQFGDASTEPPANSDIREVVRSVDTSATPSEAFKLTPELAQVISTTTPTQKQANLFTALTTLNNLKLAGAKATTEQKQQLSAFPGWGWAGQSLSAGETSNWFAKNIKPLITEKQWNAARRSSLNSHYTSPMVIQSMWDIAKHLGVDFEKNSYSVLEPAAGIGLFKSLDPGSKNKWTMVEMDDLTAGILGMIHDDAKVIHSPFEIAKLDMTGYDMVVSNVPFGDIPVRRDQEFFNKSGNPDLFTNLHNYFIAKSIDVLRDNGLAILITSKHSMDNIGDAGHNFRKWLSEHAELVGAIRLPSSAFKGNASTEVVTDILVLRKLSAGEVSHTNKFIGVTEIEAGELKYPINEYFADHPEMVLGTNTSKTSRFQKNEFEYTVESNGDLQEQLATAIKSLRKVYELGMYTAPKDAGQYSGYAPETTRHNELYVEDGVIYRNYTGKAIEVSKDKTSVAELGKFFEVKEALLNLLRGQRDGIEDAALKTLQKNLSEAYDGFVKKYGALNSKRRFWKSDPYATAVLKLEKWDSENKKVKGLADVFTKRTVNTSNVANVAKTTPDAIVASVNNLGYVSFDEMSRLTGKTHEELAKESAGLIYRDPEDPAKWVTKDQLLSGNVRKKLEQAKSAGYADAIELLEKNQPKPVLAGEVIARPGSSWLPVEFYEDFGLYLFGETKSRYGSTSYPVSITYNKFGGGYGVTKNNNNSYKQPGHTRADLRREMEESIGITSLVKHLLNNTNPVVRDKEGQVLVEETAKAGAALERLKQEFEEYTVSTPEIAEEVAKHFNEKINVFKHREYDGSFLTFPGVNPITLERPYRLDFVLQALENKSIMAAHEVGTGKTWTATLTAKKMLEIGLVKKPMFLAKNGTEHQIATEMAVAYPDMKILVGSAEDLSPSQRKEFLGDIIAGEWDMVIIPHSVAELIELSPQARSAFIDAEVQRMRDELKEMEESGESKKTVKQAENAIAKFEERMRGKIESSQKGTVDSIYWDDLGIDLLIIDEWHNFRKMPIVSKAPGMASEGSQQALNIFLKTRLAQQNNARTILMTGTPITNTMAEIYTLQRFLDEQALSDLNIRSFDAWQTVFGEIVTEVERGVTGNIQKRSRLNKFSNVPQLQNMFMNNMHVVFAADQVDADGNPIVKRPKLVADDGVTVTDAPIIVDIEPTAQQIEWFKEIDRLYKEWQALPPIERLSNKYNPLKVSSMGMMISNDVRLYDPEAKFDPDGKTARLVEKIKHVYDMTKDDKGAQIAFVDVGVPRTKAPSKASKTDDGQAQEVSPGYEQDYAFNLYADIKDRLVKSGIPAKEIAFIQDYNANEKQALYDKVNSGEVRVLMGSSQLSEGVNVQTRLKAIHLYSAPWLPKDIIQRYGRILRHGNKFTGVMIYQYIVKDSFDALKWERISKKDALFKQFMTRTDEMELEDTSGSGNVFNPAEIAAIAQGDPRMTEMMRIGSEIKDIRKKRDARARKVRAAKFELEAMRNKIESSQKRIDELQKNVEIMESAGMQDSVQITGRSKPEPFETKKDAIEYLGRELTIQRGPYENATIATINKSLELRWTYGQYVIAPSGKYNNLDTSRARRFVGGSGDYFKSAVEDFVYGLYERSVKWLQYAEQDNAQATKRAQFLESNSITNPFDEQLEKLETALERVRSDLGITDSGNAESELIWGSIYDNSDMKKSSDDLAVPFLATDVADIDPIPVPESESAKGLHPTDIMVSFQDIMPMTVRKGIVPRLTRAIYRPNNKTIVLRYRGDLWAFAHELGHKLDDIYQMVPSMQPMTTKGGAQSKRYKQFDDEILKLGQPYTPRIGTLERMRQEGIARFTQLLMVNPSEAQKQAPKFHAYFHSVVDPKVLEQMRIAGDKIRKLAWLQKNDPRKIFAEHVEMYPSERKRIVNQINSSLTLESAIAFMRESLFDKMTFDMVDDVAPIASAKAEAMKRLGIEELLPEHDPELLARLLKYQSGRTEGILQYGMVDSQGVLVTGPVSDILAPLDKSSEKALNQDLIDMFALGISERQIEEAQKIIDQAEEEALAAEDNGLDGDAIREAAKERSKALTGIDMLGVDDNEQVLNLINAIKADEERFDRVSKALVQLRKFHNALLDYAAEKGRYSLEQVQEIKDTHQHYIALNRVLDNDRDLSWLRTGKMTSVKNPIKRYWGDRRNIQSPLLSLIAQANAIVHESDRNEVMRTMVDLLSNEDQEMYKPGVDMSDLAHRIEVSETEEPFSVIVFRNGEKERWKLDEALYRGLSIVGDRDMPALDPLRKLARLVRVSITSFPAFAFFKNPVRDTLSRVILSRTGSKVSDLQFKVSDEEMRKYMMYGGGITSNKLLSGRDVFESAQRKIIANAVHSKDPWWIWVHPKELWEKYLDYASIPEIANRIAEMKSAERKAFSKGWSDHNVYLYSGNESRDSMDFLRSGRVLRQANHYIPFLTSQVQGLNRLYRAVKEDPSTLLKRILLYIVLASVIEQVLNESQDDGTELDYNQLPAYQKDFFWNFRVGSYGYIRIPKPFEMGLPGSITARLMQYVKALKDGDQVDQEAAFEGLNKDMVQVLLPLDESVLLGGPVSAFTEAFMVNRDTFRDRPIVSPYEEAVTLELRKGTKKASSFGQFMQSISNVDARQIDHVTNGTLGGYGKVLTSIGKYSPNDVEEWSYILTGAFTGTPGYSSRDVIWVLDRAKYINAGNPLRKEIDAYFEAKDSGDRQATLEAERVMVMEAKRLRLAMLEASNGKSGVESINAQRETLGKKPITLDDLSGDSSKGREKKTSPVEDLLKQMK